MSTTIEQMWVKGGTWANLNGAPQDRNHPGYDINGVKIKSCRLDQGGEINFSISTPYDE